MSIKISNSTIIDDSRNIIDASNLNITGVATLGKVRISSGIVTAVSGVVTYYGNYYGTFNGSIDSGVTLNYANNAGVATYAQVSGISTSVIGGIASVTSLNVSGISTLGTVRISSGIVTAVSGVVTYYGDGSKLQGVTAFYVDTQQNTNNPVYPTLASGVGVNSVGISTNKLVFVESTTRLGIGTANPQTNLHIVGDVNIVGVLTANRLYSNIYGEFTGGGISGTNIVGTALSISGISTFTNGPVFIGSGTSTGTASQRLQVTGGAYISGNVGIATTNPLQPLQVGSGTTIVIIDTLGDVGIGTTNATAKLYVVGDTFITGILTANRIFSNIYGEFTGGAISGTNIVGTALSISGISTIGTVRISSGIVTAVSGVVTYYGDGSKLSGVISPESNGEFYTGVSSSIQLKPLSYETSIYTFPSTAGKQYVIESINVANVDTSVGVGTTVNIIASIQNSTGEQTYIAYNVPITNGGLLELLKNAIVAGPSDVMKMWVTDGNYTGVNNATEVYMNYTEFTSTKYISKYASTVSIATTDPTAVYTSSTYPSTIEAIHFANRTDTGDYPVSVSITNGTTTTYLAKNLIIPRYATVDILDRPKRVETNGVIKVEVGQTSTIDVIIAGKQITS